MTTTVSQKQKSREFALQLLFQKEFSEALATQAWPLLFESSFSAEITEFTQYLLEGVKQHHNKIDSQIQSFAKNWKLERMSLVDRNVLRLGYFEMLLSPSPLPASIVINEYVELAKRYGTTDSGRFVNGILGQAAKEVSWQNGNIND
jgi:transcription antitermination protein NusB